MNETILLLDGQTVQAIAVSKSLKEVGYRVILFCDDKLTYGYHTKYADEKIICPSVSHSPKEFSLFLVDYLKKHLIDAIIPMNDDSATFLSKEKKELSKLVRFIMPDWEVFERAYDKNLLMEFCQEYNYPHPKSINLSKNNVVELITGIHFPALIKPNYTSGGRGMTLVKNIDEFYAAYPLIHAQYGECHLQEFIQLGGKQIKVQVFMDMDGHLINSSVIHKQRFYPENGGSSCCNLTIQNNALVEICYNVLKTIGWIGFADFDLIEDPRDGIMKIIEINPRVPACVKSASVSGIEYGLLIADLTLGKPLKKYAYNPGKQLRHIGFDSLWFLYSKNRFKTKPNWFNFFGKNIYFQDISINDIKPFFFGTFGNIKKQFSPSFRKTKSGLR